MKILRPLPSIATFFATAGARRFQLSFGLAILCSALMISSGAEAPKTPAPLNVAGPKLNADYGRLPLSFEANEGQAAKEVQFLSRAPGGTIYLKAEEAVFVIPEPKSSDGAGVTAKLKLHKPASAVSTRRHRSVVRMKLKGANTHAKPTALQKLPGIANYFIGNDPKKWHTNIPTYRQVQYRNVYPGIDLTYYGNQRQLEYDFVVKPGGDPRRIAMRIEGAERSRLDVNGDLIIATASGELRQHKPIVYQEINGKRHQIDSKYVFAGPSQVGFQIAGYDPASDLVIDPVLTYSTYLGGSGGDVGFSTTISLAGEAYVAGFTNSTNFPTMDPIQPALKGSGDAFVSRFNATGDALVYSTYLGGTGLDIARGIALDPFGNAYVAGTTESQDFPVLGGVQSALRGRNDVFVTKLNATGTALVYSTYLGGNDIEGVGTPNSGGGITVDFSGDAYVGGATYSTDFPTVNAFQAANRGLYDGFVTRLNAQGNAVVSSTYLGGTGVDLIGGIALDSNGQMCVAGTTTSTDFPTLNPVQGISGGSFDTFIAKFDASGAALVYSTYLGGSGLDQLEGFAVDPQGNAYLTGKTYSADFPTIHSVQSTFAGVADAFLTKLISTGSEIIYSTYLGGSADDSGLCVAADIAGNAYVAGFTASGDFPILNAFQVSNKGSVDAFVTKINISGSALSYSTYLGGSDGDFANGIAADSLGDAYVAGATYSTDFPTVNAFQNTTDGDSAFLTKISDTRPITSPPTATGTVGQAFSYTITADNDPVSFTAAPLPSGLTLNAVTGEISGIPTQSGVFVIQLTATGSDGSVATGTLTLTISGGGTPTPTPPPLTVSLSMHSVSAGAMSNGQQGAGIDDPIVPTASDTILKTGQPVVTSGLVADGVTPLLIQIAPNTTPSQATTFQITTMITGGDVGGATDLSSHLKVLQYSGSTQTFVSGSDVVLSAAHPNGFAYISGIDSETLLINSSAHELTATVTVTQASDSSNSRTLTFTIRRPPIVLVHGFRSDNGAWFDDAPVNQKPNAFVQQLELSVPADFIIPAEYGVDRSTYPPNDDANTFEPFIALAPKLDAQIRGLIESNNAFRAKWAFTRFDAIGHSQGGLLLRMLCTQEDPVPPDFYPFRSLANAFRGRFHRIITLGSPHNGSTLVHYLYDLESLGGGDVFSKLLPILDDLGVLQRKFDPFFDPIGNLDEINGPRWVVDPLAKFNLLGTTIYGGKEPAGPLDYFFEPLFYKLTALWARAKGQDYSRGHLVLPLGSDAMVDRSSQFAGLPGYSYTTLISDKDICHAGTGKYFMFDGTVLLFDVKLTADTDTQSSLVGSKVAGLLNGPTAVFGSFLLLRPDPELGSQIDAAVGILPQSANISPSGQNKSEKKNGAATSATSYTFLLTPVAGEEPLGAPFWYVQAFGPAGASIDGVSVTADATNSNMASVSVDADVVGDVVLYAAYTTADGNLVLGGPIIVVSRPPGTSMVGIHLVPGSLNLSVGATPRLRVWGDFNNGTQSLLYIPPDTVTNFTSSNANIVDVDSTGELTLKSPGTATVTASYLGFSAQASVTVSALPPPPLETAPLPDAPSIIVQPAASKVYIGESASISVTAGGAAPLSYQWQRKGVDIPGATSPILSLTGLTQEQGGNYSVMVSNEFGATISSPALISVLKSVQFGNISTRLKVQTADNVLIGGFIVTGTQPKRVIVRAVGPSLTSAGLSGVLADPSLELHDSTGQLIATNDNWVASANKQAIIESGVAPVKDKESAILMTLNPGAYTAIVRGVNDTTGVGLVEVYDLDQTLDSKLANISTRGLVGSDDNVLIGGLIVLGKDAARTIVRAIGPTLASFGVSDALADPVLELHDGNGAIIAANDNWRDTQESEIEATSIAPSNDAESAIVATLSPGAYTAIVRGKSNTTGIGLVEAYQLDN